MYMPLCRDCHQRETSFNQSNVFEGNPQLMDPMVEHEATALKQSGVSEAQKSISTDNDSNSFELSVE